MFFQDASSQSFAKPLVNLGHGAYRSVSTKQTCPRSQRWEPMCLLQRCDPDLGAKAVGRWLGPVTIRCVRAAQVSAFKDGEEKGANCMSPFSAVLCQQSSHQ